jgi:hypothetical protein
MNVQPACIQAAGSPCERSACPRWAGRSTGWPFRQRDGPEDQRAEQVPDPRTARNDPAHRLVPRRGFGSVIDRNLRTATCSTRARSEPSRDLAKPPSRASVRTDCTKSTRRHVSPSAACRSKPGANHRRAHVSRKPQVARHATAPGISTREPASVFTPKRSPLTHGGVEERCCVWVQFAAADVGVLEELGLAHQVCLGRSVRLTSSSRWWRRCGARCGASSSPARLGTCPPYAPADVRRPSVGRPCRHGRRQRRPATQGRCRHGRSLVRSRSVTNSGSGTIRNAIADLPWWTERPLPLTG